MAPSACLSPVVTLALLLLITGFALGGEFIFSINLPDSYKSNNYNSLSIFSCFFFFGGGGGGGRGGGGRHCRREYAKIYSGSVFRLRLRLLLKCRIPREDILKGVSLFHIHLISVCLPVCLSVSVSLCLPLSLSLSPPPPFFLFLGAFFEGKQNRRRSKCCHFHNTVKAKAHEGHRNATLRGAFNFYSLTVFPVEGLSSNSLPQDLRHCSTLSYFKAILKTFLFSQYFHPN